MQLRQVLLTLPACFLTSLSPIWLRVQFSRYSLHYGYRARCGSDHPKHRLRHLTARSTTMSIRFIYFVLSICLIILAPLRAADLCDPNRPFCGRITVIIVGAGEKGDYYGGIEAVDDDLPDPASAYAYADFHMFRRHEGAAAYMIVMTSQPKLRARLEGLSAKIKTDAGFLGVAPASVDAFQDLVSDDANVSLLARAISNFSNNLRCQRMIKAQGLDSVLPLLKTGIVVEGQNINGGGIALWSNKSETGALAEWEKKAEPPILDEGIISKLCDKLGDGVIQVFVESCNGAQIGGHFQNPQQCSCYLSTSDSDTLYFTGGEHLSACFLTKVSAFVHEKRIRLECEMLPISVLECYKTSKITP